MEQLWNHIYVCAKDQHFFLTQTREQLRIKPVNLLLGYLHQCKIDWTDASLWPEDYVEGQWKRVVPMSFLVASIGENVTGSYWVLDALCMGERLSRPAKSALHDQDQHPPSDPRACRAHGDDLLCERGAVSSGHSWLGCRAAVDG